MWRCYTKYPLLYLFMRRMLKLDNDCHDFWRCSSSIKNAEHEKDFHSNNFGYNFAYGECPGTG